ncbi:SAM hydrolase/SAM-dependent halogenase family protein [Flavihumibacter petaseus]|uniref:DNA-directed RNA polymerase subunit delta n=1 Tax=Flavihumibacter petaseus NBRC 106054 TaxID=1220578 RepID=A0A0E9N7D9_9BACT|nr:S-adenosyl-l-methionine hydroxide adenosyltransferase family protein [Flavihumibacter petaseus]GAO45265.1 hypothetical protein FPE01S_04_05090 [Flavihumibacter petaseus NBRC 106054]
MHRRRFSGIVLALITLQSAISAYSQTGALVFQTDFGLKDGAVSAMKGVAFGVSPELKQFDLTHEIPPFNIWEGAYRLEQTVAYWPAGTVFVSVVDPGVGSNRKSVVAKLKTGQFVVTPDNGTLTLLAEAPGIDSLRQIDESVNRLKGSGDSYTFHGRDVYAYTGARLAAGKISFTEVGPLLPDPVIRLPYQQATVKTGLILGNIPVLDVQYGNVWTNIRASLLATIGIHYGDTILVEILQGKKQVYRGAMLYGTTFSAVPEGKPVAYSNSLLQLAFGINMGDFASTWHVGSGNNWTVKVQKQRTDHSRAK